MLGTAHIFRASTLAAALLLAAVPAAGAVFFDLADGELEKGASSIVVGRIAAAESAPGPALDYRVEIETVVRGKPPQELVLRLPGGVRDGLGLVVPGTPRLRPGDRALVFLRSRGDGTFALSHPFLGAFRIVASEHGSEIAVREPHGHASAPLQSGDKTETGFDRDLERFVRWLADRGRGVRRPPDYFLSRPAEKSFGQDPSKWEPVVSSTEPEPFGCGETGGHGVRWFDFDEGGSAGWRAHYSGQEGLPDGGQGQFRVALDVWSADPHSAIDLEFVGLTAADNGFAGPDGVNTLLFGDPRDQIPGSVEDNGLLALGGPWFLCELREARGELFHPIIEADIVTQDGLDVFLAASPQLRRAAEEIFAHELGHTLGFAHTADPQALMFAFAHNDGRGAALGVDDLSGAFDLYGQGDPPQLPAAPADLEVTAVFATAVQLAWTDTSMAGTVAGESNFRLERRRGQGEFTPAAVIAAGHESYFDAAVEPESDYGYRIRAQNAAGASAYSAEVTVTTPEDPRPEAPSNLRAAPLSSRSIRLAWQDNSDDETSFVLSLLDPGTSSFVEVPYAIPIDTTTVLLTELEPGVKYTFRVRARNGFGTSGASNTASAGTYADDSGCVSGETELCLLGGRFRVRLSFLDPGLDGGVERSATAIPNTDQTGLFWFFESGNVELVVKMLDGREVNGHFWVFYGGITDLEFALEIEDTETGRTAVYQNRRGEICGGADVLAFPTAAPGGGYRPVAKAAPADFQAAAIGVQAVTVPASGTGAATAEPLPVGDCVPGPRSLCLLNGRLRVEVEWKDFHAGGREGEGQAVVLSDESGYFWFFAPENLELVVKALDGGGVNGHLWFYYGALTDLEYHVTVTDTVSGDRRVYDNPAGELCGGADILAFGLGP